MSARIMIAGTGSGSGKTTVTCAVIAALIDLEKQVVSYKCGPDYIDPMFHAKTSGVAALNLDIFLMGEEGVNYSLQRHQDDFDIAVIEGVMGLYDGQSDTSYASSNHVSLLTGTPVVLVVNPSGMGLSVCAFISGYLGFAENNIKAVLLNKVRPSSYPYYKQMIEDNLGIPVIGYLPQVPGAEISSRQLGLVSAEEIIDIKEKIKALGDQALLSIDFPALLGIASQAEALPRDAGPHVASADEHSADLPPAKIYIANDQAFCFYYQENHELLESLGAKVEFFSPLIDSQLPEDADGLVLWGGYPELYAGQLQANESLRESIKAAIGKGLPVYAECGGFAYLHERLVDQGQGMYQMLGVLPGTVRITDTLQDFGYFALTAQSDNMLCPAGTTFNAHFFHYSHSDNPGSSFNAVKPDGRSMSCIVAEKNIFAGHQHLHFIGQANLAASFVSACVEYRKGKNG
ncbi:MAG: cobyrinate a,c-diamide synthase [Coriobacteriia bacterium]|nr:cobyrinate a,c-diamide synthase [Coriobacteriia bacterium]